MRKYLYILLSITLLPAAFCSAVWAEEGLTDTEIHIASFGPLTGPAKMWDGAVYGAGMVFDKVNAEGGLHGRKIIYHTLDDSYNPAKTKAGVKRMQEKVGIFAWVGGVGTANGQAVKKYLTNRNVPWIGPLSGSNVWVSPPTKTIFAIYPHYTLEAKLLVRHAVKNMGKERIAIVYLNGGYGKSGLEGVKSGLAESNKELVAAISVERNTADMQPIALQLLKSKADTVILWATPFQMLRLIVNSKKMKFQPQWMACSVLSDFKTMDKLSKGQITGMITAMFEQFEDKAQTAEYRNAHKKYGKKGREWVPPYLIGIGAAQILVEGLNRCGRDLTREKLVSKLENLKNYRGMGGEINYKPYDVNDPTCRQGLNKIYLQQCEPGGEAKRITDWMSE